MDGSPPDNLPDEDALAKLQLPAPLRAYQWQGVAFLARSEAVLLADEMGLGKMVQTIVALKLCLKRGPGTLIIADGKLIVLTEKGIFSIAKAVPEAFQPVAEAKVLEGRCWSTPAIADGRLYLRNAAGDAACLDLARR